LLVRGRQPSVVRADTASQCSSPAKHSYLSVSAPGLIVFTVVPEQDQRLHRNSILLRLFCWTYSSVFTQSRKPVSFLTILLCVTVPYVHIVRWCEMIY